jgi:hypothetical protein
VDGAAPDIAEFIIGPAEGRTRWLYPGDEGLIGQEKSFKASVIWPHCRALSGKIFCFYLTQITGLLRLSCPARGDVGRRH